MMKLQILSVVFLALAPRTFATRRWWEKWLRPPFVFMNRRDEVRQRLPRELEERINGPPIDGSQDDDDSSFHSDYQIPEDGFYWFSGGIGEYFDEVDNDWVDRFLSCFGDGCVSDETMAENLITQSFDNRENPLITHTRPDSAFSEVRIGLQVTAGTRLLAFVSLMRKLLRYEQDRDPERPRIRIPKLTLSHPEDIGEVPKRPTVFGGPWRGYRRYWAHAQGESADPDSHDPMTIMIEIYAVPKEGRPQSMELDDYLRQQRRQRKAHERQNRDRNVRTVHWNDDPGPSTGGFPRRRLQPSGPQPLDNRGPRSNVCLERSTLGMLWGDNAEKVEIDSIKEVPGPSH